MTDFIFAPAIVGICVFGFYKFVELLVRRRERLLMVEKISEISAADGVNLSKIFEPNSSTGGRFLALRFGCTLLGIGLGLLIGFAIVYSLFGMDYPGDIPYRIKETMGLIYGASTLIFGGLALLICFIVEQKMKK